MRYQNWDILLFSCSTEPDLGRVPMQEFHTRCYVEQSTVFQLPPTLTPPWQTCGMVPVLTCFVPAVRRRSPFSISVHSWAPTAPLFRSLGYQTGHALEVWKACVVIDGRLGASRIWPIDTAWPQTILTVNDPTFYINDGGPLAFPAFHREAMHEIHYDVSEPRGRIRIELYAGYIDNHFAQFVALMNLVNFSFQAVPLGALEAGALAWPNERMYRDFLLRSAIFPGPSANNLPRFPIADTVPHHNSPASETQIQSRMTPCVSAGSIALNSVSQESPDGLQPSNTPAPHYSNISNSAASMQPPRPTCALDNFTNAPIHQLRALRPPVDQVQSVIANNDALAVPEVIPAQAETILPAVKDYHTTFNNLPTEARGDGDEFNDPAAIPKDAENPNARGHFNHLYHCLDTKVAGQSHRDASSASPHGLDRNHLHINPRQLLLGAAGKVRIRREGSSPTKCKRVHSSLDPSVVPSVRNRSLTASKIAAPVVSSTVGFARVVGSGNGPATPTAQHDTPLQHFVTAISPDERSESRRKRPRTTYHAHGDYDEHTVR